MINLSKQKWTILFFLICVPFFLRAQTAKILTNHVGYEDSKSKKAILISEKKLDFSAFQLIDAETGKVAFSGKPVFSGPVSKWKNWLFWTIDFSSFSKKGNYLIKAVSLGNTIASYPFIIDKNVLEQSTLSNVVYYFKGQRSSGLMDKADRTLILSGHPKDTIDAHGGWYDASGDYGKHLSHLTFSSYFNPQQISLTAWTLFKTYELSAKRKGNDFRQYKRRLLDEAMYGADYLVRMQAKDGSFYRSVSAPGAGKFAKDRVIRAEDQSYRIKKTEGQAFSDSDKSNDLKKYQVSYRSGGGVSIAALAMASVYDSSGDFTNKDYLLAAEKAFGFLEKHNVEMTNDGKENIVDDYCALTAATELFKATGKEIYAKAAAKRANNLISRLTSWNKETNYWRADEKDRPFFHPSDAGFPIASLSYYYPLATSADRVKVKETIRKSLVHELEITHDVNNPFGYSRQLVQDTIGNKRTTFFFPHGSDASPWWQGENARLASIAAAARLAAPLFNDDKTFRNSLETFALDQLNWILGLNPYDVSMLQGSGHNNPTYGFFGTFEYTNAPGGIANGITSGLTNQDDIDFNLSYAKTGMDNDWRWAEQWLPHAAWYMLAISVNE
ncbi:glycoside hydrolase family 9 protein [Dyadobacter frigoris]|uniref:Glycoside hydrolase n=1 Tax=Dyadobacter frigoris TaxID=2576211 RepID=A0A4U6D6W9_9BACT|nr:glycoside hydrolase family 9 protein [Dyadobacter frigoris]TKT93112.1 glycoside hydrolase [Dyadobacter frigoris]GLU55986.1 endochitinase [Dyadobacter frigoris]